MVDNASEPASTALSKDNTSYRWRAGPAHVSCRGKYRNWGKVSMQNAVEVVRREDSPYAVQLKRLLFQHLLSQTKFL